MARTNPERAEATRTALMAAARKLFVEKGYAETGTPEIVARAGVTRGALYHHFADKAALMRAVVEAEALAVAETIEVATADVRDAHEGLTKGSDAYFRAMAVPGRTRLLLRDGPSVLGADEMARIDRATGGRTLVDGLTAARAEGHLKGLPLDALADVLSGAFDRAALSVAEGAPPAPYTRALRSVLDALLR